MTSTEKKASRLFSVRSAVALVLVVIVVAALMNAIYLKKYGNLNASAVISPQGIGVYRDYASTNAVTNVDWGSLSPGSTKNIKVYIRNEANETRNLSISSADWVPTGADAQLSFSWKSTTVQIDPGEIANVTLSLYVSKTISGISAFSFDVVVSSSTGLLGDVNQDGKVDMRDVQIIVSAMFSGNGSPNWDPRADLDGNSIVDMRDLAILLLHFGDNIA